MADTKISTVIACRVSLEYADALYKQAYDTHTTVAEIMRKGLVLVGPSLQDKVSENEPTTHASWSGTNNGDLQTRLLRHFIPRKITTSKKLKVRRQKLPVEYNIWTAMMRRCFDPNNPGFKSYGGRGITVCDRWKNFSLFFEDMGSRPPGKTKSGNAAYTLERKNNDGNYEPGNCVWATWAEQAQNRRNNRKRVLTTETKMSKLA